MVFPHSAEKRGGARDPLHAHETARRVQRATNRLLDVMETVNTPMSVQAHMMCRRT